MADKTSKTAAGTGDMKPVPMKLFSSWEVERTAPNCIPRLCSLTLTRLVVLKPLETDLTSVLIAVKMQSSKRVLRSNEIFIPQSGTLDTTLELSFSLQYPHFLKRDSNKLQIMLQRRKRYKNRPVLGFKTLAVGLVNMAQVLQRPMDSDLNMYSKESKSHVAAVRIVGMSSQPVDHEEGATGGRRKAESTGERRFSLLTPSDLYQHYMLRKSGGDLATPDVNNFWENGPTNDPISDGDNGEPDRDSAFTLADRSPGEDNESDEDDEFFSSDQEGSDSEGNIGGAQDLLDEDIRGKKSGRRKVRPTLSRQRNFKQKFIALLKKFKVPDEVLDSEADQYAEQEGHARDIDEELDLYNIDDLDLSDSGQEIDDNTSIISTPKPSLRPFFSQGVHTISQEIPQTQVMDISDDVGLRPETEGLQDPSGDLDTHSDMGSPARDKKISQKSLSPQAKERPSSANRERSISMRERKVTSKDMARERRNSTGVPEAQGGRRDINTRKLSCPPQNLSSLGVVNEQAEVHHVTDSRKMSAPTHLISNASQYEKSVVRKTKSGPGVLVIQDQVRWGTVPHKSLYDQLAHIIPSDEHLPDSVVLVNTAEWQAQTQLLAQKLQELHHRVVCTSSQADVNATFSFLVAKIQKFCNFNSQQPIPIRVVLVGGESYVHAILRPYVDQFSQKPPDWQNHIKFYIVPLGGHVLARYLASIDSKYNATFNDQTWKEAFEKPDSSTQPDYQEVIGKISSFVLSANVTHQLPIAEAMLTYKAKVTDEESTQTFIPFVGDVRVGSSESANLSVSMDMDDGVSGSPQLASGLTATPTSTSQQAIKDMKETATPPTSTLGSPGQMPQSENTQVLLTSTDPSSGAVPKVKAMAMYISPSSQTEVLDLQIDYWLSSPPREGGKEKEKDKKEMTKGTVKTSVRWLQVNRLPVSGDVSGSSGTLTMVLVTKEKKQKIMRIGKKAKDKEAESKSQTIEAVNRLICTSKSQSSPLKVTIDGSDWSGVKFFQLSAQWQTHIKHFPVGLFGHTETAC
ncbi:phosphofurin acidic cluster sorting protein 2-like isoform X3 [Branchiostoma floridae]|uniref:Phosphofurin acidic cluster sorting protein 2-like isoform X3 n=1 Tax=Branchiostoma floridae TaxID=7739 RepID=A0A9J7MJ38_BRAFL|nr:phosphofurin acidic cluster sorting protein 2-like isoform X3 [Branchiostoma floridae]